MVEHRQNRARKRSNTNEAGKMIMNYQLADRYKSFEAMMLKHTQTRRKSKQAWGRNRVRWSRTLQTATKERKSIIIEQFIIDLCELVDSFVLCQSKWQSLFIRNFRMPLEVPMVFATCYFFSLLRVQMIQYSFQNYTKQIRWMDE